MNNKFDELAKGLAQSVPRRRVGGATRMPTAIRTRATSATWGAAVLFATAR